MKIIHVRLPKVMSNFCYYRRKYLFIRYISFEVRLLNKKKRSYRFKWCEISGPYRMLWLIAYTNIQKKPV